MNVVATLRVDLNIPETQVEALMGKPDDDSEGYRQNALDTVQKWIEEEPGQALHFTGASQPEAEVDG